MKFLLLALSAFLTACASGEISSEFRYSAEDPQGIIAPAVWSGHDYNIYTIHQVDLKTGKFLGPPVRMRAPGRKLALKDTETDGASYYLELKKVPPGDYALISREYGRRPTSALHAFDSGTYGQAIRNCYSEGSPVFKIDPGKISVVKFEKVAVRPSVLRDFRNRIPEVMARYPLITAPAEIVSPEAIIKFVSVFKKYEKNCQAESDFTIIREGD
ncbi:hypothetical protein NBZ79_02965 [Sneathiella marina]|uniref:Lipoprotein n=1 Tax=Sneathiella marina TaxID=2950108 RepID=A0ABY4W539_9PROT|nr:hypothetical protein [Sneathiella marina]USG61934.1 hypothetical protein NBZ79_02965 [Sneathiella marina]